MKVLKFGGTSVGSAQRMKEVAKLITGGERKVVVLSAMSGTTNSLVEISDYLYKKNPDGANEIINQLAMKYMGHVEELYSTEEYKQKAKELIKSHFDYIRTFTKDLFTLFEEKVILAQGELISTGMMHLYLNECGVNAVLIPALDYMRTDKNAEPDPVYIKEKLLKLLNEHKDADLYLTQGYICRNAYGEIDNLQRGGSDYSASLIGAAIDAEEIQIWTDIDGMHNNDPRFVEGTSPVRHLHFNEAAELAYFGAKILHPTCILPAKLNNIPVRLLNTMQPEAPGWLYEVNQGANTVWETWTGIDAEGKPHESLNHYSYGAICGWLFGGVCGIHLADEKLTIAPTPHKVLGYAKAVYNSPVGYIASSWRYDGDSVCYEFTIPSNMVADIYLPDGRAMTLSSGTHKI